MTKIAALVIAATLTAAPCRANLVDTVKDWLKSQGQAPVEQNVPVTAAPAGVIATGDMALSPETQAALKANDVELYWSLIKKQANEGNSEAQFRMAGFEYRKGNPGKAYAWYEKAADAGHVESQYMLGFSYSSYNNWEKASYWLGKAAAGGHKEAQYDLAELYRKGKLPANPEMMLKLYCSAAAQGHATSARRVTELNETCSPVK